MQNNLKRILSIFLTVLLLAGVLGYSFFRAKDFLRGPVVSFLSPQNGITVSEQLLEVSGTSQNLSYINLNGRKIFTDKDGKWGEKVLLSEGYNIIEVAAEDRFGRKIKKTMEVIYEEKTKQNV